jgi:hypothetical protein
MKANHAIKDNYSSSKSDIFKFWYMYHIRKSVPQ